MRRLDFILKRFKRKDSSREGKPLKINKSDLLNIGLVIILIIIIVLMFPRGRSFQFADLTEGSVYTGPEIIAPFTFAVNKSEDEYNQDVAKARESVLPVFVFTDSIARNQINNLNRLFQKLENLLSRSNASEESLRVFLKDHNVVMSNDDISYLFDHYSIASLLVKPHGNSPAKRRNSVKTAFRDSIATIALKVAEGVFSAGILDREKTELPPNVKAISVVYSNQEVVEELSFHHGINEAKQALLDKLRTDGNVNQRIVRIAYEILESYCTPTIFYDKEETENRIEEAIANVPLAKNQVLEGERIIDSHERVTKQHIDKLRSLSLAKAERGEQERGLLARIAPFLGKFLFIALTLSIIIVYLYRNQRQTLTDRKEIILIGLIILLISFSTFLINRFALSGFLVPIVIGSMLLTIFFDSKLGFVGTVALGILIGGMRGNEYSMTATAIIAGSVAVLTVTRVRSRNWLLHSIAYVIATYFLLVTVLDFIRYTPFSEIMLDWGYGAINGFLAPIFTYGLIVVLEFSFDITTDMTLLELSDLNQPLLRQLAMRAPGTYHHSIIVGNLSEAAAEAISANSLLARVGAYYHDIGKMEKADYFIENQQKGRNPQEKLNPSMSTLILINHIRKGIELARENGLPKEIEAFISEHHGTSLISYFYQKAKESSENVEVSEMDFRYPGPKPTSKETAIVMLADAVEAASRTLKEPTASRMKGMVNELVSGRFKSGELDNSPLTLRDLSKISEAFQKILFGIFHGRIEYPKMQKSEENNSHKSSEVKNNRSSV